MLHQEELIKLITSNIPKLPPRQYGMLDIVGRTSHENTISTVYQYFLNQKRSPFLSVLMMDSLLELINEKHEELARPLKQLDLFYYNVRREVGTEKQKRIDLLIESRESRSAIIIEVKVHAQLYNNLCEYWNHISFTEENKVGIVLSLERMNPHNFTCQNFINITHVEWLNRVMKKGLPGEMPLKEIVYFKDFVNNMNQLTRQMEMNDSILFYIEHSERIDKAIATQTAAADYVKNHLREASHALNFDYVERRNTNKWAHLRPKTGGGKKIWYWIKPDKIIKSLPEVLITIEMEKKHEVVRDQMHEIILKEFNSFTTSQYEELLTGGPVTTHICRKTYQFDPKGKESLSEMLQRVFVEMNQVRERLLKMIEQ
jgi:hypothetical protein